MKTIQDLEEKILYRLLKVVSIFFLILFSLLAGTDIYSSLDKGLSRCIFAEMDKEFGFAPKVTEAKPTPKTGLLTNESAIDSFMCRFANRDSMILARMVIIAFSVLGVIAVWFGFEVFRRIIYYVLLGSLFPKKS